MGVLPYRHERDAGWPAVHLSCRSRLFHRKQHVIEQLLACACCLRMCHSCIITTMQRKGCCNAVLVTFRHVQVLLHQPGGLVNPGADRVSAGHSNRSVHYQQRASLQHCRLHGRDVWHQVQPGGLERAHPRGLHLPLCRHHHGFPEVPEFSEALTAGPGAPVMHVRLHLQSS